MLRKYEVKIIIESDTETIKDGVEAARKMMQERCFTVGDVRNVDEITERQKRALHLYFSQLADAFSAGGLDVKSVLSKNIEHPWTAALVKELIWRRVQVALTGKKSTTKLDKVEEINKIYDVINRWIGQEFKIHIPFPSIESQFHDQES